jgi:hypothetical protein
LTVCNPVDHRRQRVGAEDVRRAYAVATEAYELLGVRENLALDVDAAQEAIGQKVADSILSGD